MRRLQLTNIPGATRFGIDIFGLSDPGILDLGYLGMPGCMLRASPDALRFGSYSGVTHNYSLVIPSSTLLNLSLYTTSAAFSDQPINPTGVVFSNGIHGQIGNS